MKNMKILGVFTLALSVALFSTACQSGQSEKKEESSSGRGFGMDQMNSIIGKVNYSPKGKGFPYKSTNVPQDDFKEWAGKNKAEIQKVLDSMDSNFVLQITGHTDSTGPRDAQADGRKGNTWYSKERAQSVYNALIETGYPASKLEVKGVADDENLPGVDADDVSNRRVTFKIVPKK